MKHPDRRRASSLVTTLLVVSILTIIVVAFLQSMTIERRVAVSYSNLTRAKMAADAGADEAMEIVRGIFRNYPDSATAWVPNMAPASSTNVTPGTAFFYYDTVSVTNMGFAAVTNLFFRPLISGATSVPIASRSNALANVGNLSNWININSTNLMEGRALIGRPPGTTIDPRIDLPWVNITNNNKVIARYAFWVEDESFRVNLSVATNVLRGASSLGADVSEIPAQGALRDTIAADGTRGIVATNIVALRGKLPFDGKLKSIANINYADGSYPDLSESVGFITTVESSGLNISRTGARRVSLVGLNGLMATNTAPTNTVLIRKELDRIIGVITNQTPLFGQRFYRPSAAPLPTTALVNSADENIYLTRIAANIRDYVDVDNVPTQVQSSGNIYSAKPAFPVGGVVSGANVLNNFKAIGKENAPRLVESVMRVPQLTAMAGAGQNSRYDIRISYYLEFWNMGTKDITVDDLCSSPGADDAFLRIGNQPEWINKTASGRMPVLGADRPFEVKLSSFRSGTNALTFKAGQVTVLTTDPQIDSIPPDSHWTQRWVSTSEIYRTSENLDLTQYASGTAGVTPVDRYASLATLDLLTRPNEQINPVAAPQTDVGTYVLLGNNFGYIDSQRSGVVIGPAVFVDSFGSKNNKSLLHFRGGRIHPNNGDSYVSTGTPYQVGDPRASVDPIFFSSFNDMSSAASTHFKNWRDSSTQSTANPSHLENLGKLNSGFVPFSTTTANRWSDAGGRTPSDGATSGIVTHVANSALKSIGELGYIYDPAHISSGAVDTAAGGGRSLRIGRSEKAAYAGDPAAQWDGTNNSASYRWAAWRLCDFFSSREETNARGEYETKGLINPNGALRDGGQAVTAILEGIRYSATGTETVVDSDLANVNISPADIQAFRTALTNRLTQANPLLPSVFFERGEFSELDYFNTASMSGKANPNDSAREELFRRMVELITTKGNTFTVYVVGQSITTPPDGKIRPTATQIRKTTFSVTPQYRDSVAPLEPPINDALTNRMAAPTNYVVKILSASDS